MELSRDTKGVWRVYTESSSYIVDMDKKKALRIEEDGKKSFGNSDSDVSKFLEMDGWFQFKVVRALIGMPMFLWVASEEDPKQTVERQSTTVRQIIKIA
jgi:hypothetical protein